MSFDSEGSLIAALEGVHTVISAIGDRSHSAPAELALVNAAISANVTRFVPSGWSVTNRGEDEILELYRFQQPVFPALREFELEWSHLSVEICHPPRGTHLQVGSSPADTTYTSGGLYVVV